MKTNFIKSLFIIVCTSAALSSCVNDDDFTIPNLDCIEPNLAANTTVQDMYSLATANVQQFPANVISDDILEAYVVSSDQGGNFFKTLSLQTIPTDNTPARGFSVPVDVVTLFSAFQPGRKVYIKLNGTYFNITNSSLVIGDIFINQTTGAASVGRLNAFSYGNVLKRSCETVDEEVLVSKISISEALNDSRLNTLIELQNVQFSENALGNNYYDPNNVLGGATNHLLTDAEGNSIIFRTSSFANYAGSPVPEGQGTVRGILTKFGNDYQFVARTENDINLDGPRLAPIFSENFESVPTGTTAFIALPGWTNIQMNGTDPRWTGRIFSNNKYAQMSAFNSGNTNVDSRLITPAINLDNTENEFLRFGYKTGFANGIALQVWYSTDYDGSGTAAAVNAATWTQFDTNLNVQDTSYSSTFYGSGNIDLSSIQGNVYICFRYVGSSTGVTTTYQIDNIEVFGGQ
jgi:hypothetical protein